MQSFLDVLPEDIDALSILLGLLVSVDWLSLLRNRSSNVLPE